MTGAMIKMYRKSQVAQAFRWEGQSLEGVKLGRQHHVENGTLVVIGPTGRTTRIEHGEWCVDDTKMDAFEPPLTNTFQDVIALTDEAFQRHWGKV